MKYKAFFFDLDGTLLDTLDDIVFALNKSLEECGYSIRYTKDQGMHFIGNGAHVLAQRAFAFRSYDEKDYQHFEQIFFANYLKYQNKTTHPFPGVVEMLIKLHKAGGSLFVVTNKPDSLAQVVVANKLAGVSFQEVIGAKPNMRNKPYPDCLNEAMMRYGYDKNDVLFIGDSSVDIDTANNADIDCCFVEYGYGLDHVAISKKATYVASSVESLEQILLH